MTLHTKVSGTWKEADPRVKVSGTWKDVSDGWVKVAGAWKRFYQRFLVELGGIVVIGDVNVAPAASLTLNTDGTMSATGNISTVGANWGTPTTTGIGASYWARMTKNSGANPTTGTLNTWLQLSSQRVWSWQSDPNDANVTLEIATDSGGSNVVDSVTFDVSLTSV